MALGSGGVGGCLAEYRVRNREMQSDFKKKKGALKRWGIRKQRASQADVAKCLKLSNKHLVVFYKLQQPVDKFAAGRTSP